MTGWFNRVTIVLSTRILSEMRSLEGSRSCGICPIYLTEEKGWGLSFIVSKVPGHRLLVAQIHFVLVHWTDKTYLGQNNQKYLGLTSPTVWDTLSQITAPGLPVTLI